MAYVLRYAAIKKYQPETVITAWMTLKTEDREDVAAGHSYAPDEEEISDTGVTYIHIGNKNIHGDCGCKASPNKGFSRMYSASRRHRPIIDKPHKIYYFDWLVSRGKHPAKNCICVWSS